MNTTEIKTIIDKLVQNGVLFLEITGGEPLIRKDILDIFEYLSEKDLVITLFTNGIFLNEEIVEVLKKVKIKQILISLLSPVEKECDRLTEVKGRFRNIINSIELLKKSKLNFGVNVCLTKENINRYKDFMELSKKLGIKFKITNNVIPSFDSQDDMVRYIIDEKNMDSIKKFFPQNLHKQSFNYSRHICEAGKSYFAIDPEGNILACNHARTIYGNLLRDAFVDIWNSEMLAYDVNVNLVQPEKCSICKYRSYCMSCPGDAYRHTGKYDLRSADICKKARILYMSQNRQSIEIILKKQV